MMKNTVSYLQVLTIVAFAITFTSCDNKRFYESYLPTGTNGWHKDSLVSFMVEVKDTNQYFNLYISARNLEQYPYNNLWLFVDVTAPDNSVINDTIEYSLAYPNGKWTGRGTSGVYLNQFQYRNNIFFPHKGNYSFTIRHAMRDDVLKGLNDIGIRIEKRN
jgi:gliding motility-associated lipoprotein GldH